MSADHDEARTAGRGGRSIWVMSPVTTIFEPKPSRVRNIFICSGARVLRLVEDDEAVVQRASAHEGQRRDLDHAALEVLGHALGLEHVVQRVEQRPQVGVDLGHQVAGQEAQPLAGLDRGAGEDDAVDLAARTAPAAAIATARKVLPVPAGPMPKVIVLRADRVDVALLVDASWARPWCAVAPDDVLEDRARATRAGRARWSPPRSCRARSRGPGRSRSASSRTTCSPASTASSRPSSVSTLPRRKTLAVEVALERPQDRVLGAGELGGDVVGELELRTHASVLLHQRRDALAVGAAVDRGHHAPHDLAHVLGRRGARSRATASATMRASSSSESSAGR